MQQTVVHPMDATEIAEFLDSQRTGVLALASDGDAYAVPVSYTYDIDEQAVYFRLGFAPGSQKERFIDTTEHAAFVVYGEAEGHWNSVVASGRLEPMSDTNLDSTILEAVKGLDIPYFKVFDRPAEDMEFAIVRLNVDGLNGIVEGQ